jgi:hypothetical protein
MELIVYYTLLNIMLFGGIILFSKMLEHFGAHIITENDATCRDLEMSNRIYENKNSIEFSYKSNCFEMTAYPDGLGTNILKGDIITRCEEGTGWSAQSAGIVITAEEATRMKEFLIKQGY